MKRACSARTAPHAIARHHPRDAERRRRHAAAGAMPMPCQRRRAGSHVVIGRVDARADDADGGEAVNQARASASRV